MTVDDEDQILGREFREAIDQGPPQPSWSEIEKRAGRFSLRRQGGRLKLVPASRSPLAGHRDPGACLCGRERLVQQRESTVPERHLRLRRGRRAAGNACRYADGFGRPAPRHGAAALETEHGCPLGRSDKRRQLLLRHPGGDRRGRLPRRPEGRLHTGRRRQHRLAGPGPRLGGRTSNTTSAVVRTTATSTWPLMSALVVRTIPSISGSNGSDTPIVLVSGGSGLQDADTIEVKYQDGGSDSFPTMHVSSPVDATMFMFQIPVTHTTAGSRPVELVLKDKDGNVLASDEAALSNLWAVEVRSAASYKGPDGSGAPPPAGSVPPQCDLFGQKGLNRDGPLTSGDQPDRAGLQFPTTSPGNGARRASRPTKFAPVPVPRTFSSPTPPRPSPDRRVALTWKN